jgi:hypothetical protein
LRLKIFTAKSRKGSTEFLKENIHMLSKKTLILLLLSLTAGTACSRKLSYEKYLKYINDPVHGLVQERTINGIDIKVTYRPSELLVYQELHNHDSISKDDIREARERYDKQYYIVLSLSQGGKEILSNTTDRQQYSAILSELAFGIGQYLTLTTTKSDTLHLIDFQYSRMFDMTNSTDILFAYENKSRKPENLMLSFQEFGMKTGNFRFVFKKQNIFKANRLKLKII